MIDREMLEAIGELLAPIIKEQREIREDLQAVKADVAQIPDIRRDVNLILESQQGINEKFALLDEVAERVADIQITVNAMEAVTKQNCTDIKQLRAVK